MTFRGSPRAIPWGSSACARSPGSGVAQKKAPQVSMYRLQPGLWRLQGGRNFAPARPARPPALRPDPRATIWIFPRHRRGYPPKLRNKKKLHFSELPCSGHSAIRNYRAQVSPLSGPTVLPSYRKFVSLTTGTHTSASSFPLFSRHSPAGRFSHDQDACVPVLRGNSTYGMFFLLFIHRITITGHSVRRAPSIAE